MRKQRSGNTGKKNNFQIRERYRAPERIQMHNRPIVSGWQPVSGTEVVQYTRMAIGYPETDSPHKRTNFDVERNKRMEISGWMILGDLDVPPNQCAVGHGTQEWVT